MSVQKSWTELQKMHRACTILADTLAALAAAAIPGVKTKELDLLARERIERAGAKPAFLGYRGFPATLCISVNEQVIHGIPGDRKLKDGDIVGLDLGCIVGGFYGDAARTVGVGHVSDTATRLMAVTEQALALGVAQCVPGRRLGDVGHAIEEHALSHGYSVVRDFCGHGIGTSLHEEPQVPNFGDPGKGMKLRPGMVLAIEPMVNAGGQDVRMDADGWTARTADGSLSAHFEYSVAVTDRGPRVLGVAV